VKNLCDPNLLHSSHRTQLGADRDGMGFLEFRIPVDPALKAEEVFFTQLRTIRFSV
jgi:hypothetical protein